MAQSGYTPIQLYYSTTAAAVPVAGNLSSGEMAINITDGKLFYKDNGGVVQTIATKTSGAFTWPSAGIPNSTGSAWSTSYSTTGSGTVVALATSPSFTTPTLGVASATSVNKLTITAPATSATLTVADGKTLTASNSLTLAGTDGKTLTVNNSITFTGTDATTMTFPSASASVGYLNVPINSKTADYTAVLSDSGKAIVLTSGSGVTFTIPANGSVAYDTGTVLTFVNMSSSSVSIAITSDTMYLSGSGATGTRTLAQYGVATAIKLTSTTWLISGNNLT